MRHRTGGTEVLGNSIFQATLCLQAWHGNICLDHLSVIWSQKINISDSFLAWWWGNIHHSPFTSRRRMKQSISRNTKGQLEIGLFLPKMVDYSLFCGITGMIPIIPTITQSSLYSISKFPTNSFVKPCWKQWENRYALERNLCTEQLLQLLIISEKKASLTLKTYAE